MSMDLAWLPVLPDWAELLSAARQEEHADRAFAMFEHLANSRMDFVRCGRLDKAVQRYLAEHEATGRGMGTGTGTRPSIRVALLGSSTVSHLLPGIRMGGLRRGFLIEVYVGAYGMYRQELADTNSGLHRFAPDVVYFLFDAQHLALAENASVEQAMANVLQCWEAARSGLRCAVMQQTVLPRLPGLMGNHEFRLEQSPATMVEEINGAIRKSAKDSSVMLLSVDTWAAADGLRHWFDPAMWFSAKQEVHPQATVMYGDQVGRMLAAWRGRSAKCLVLDLDNTCWGGVIGDDGPEGIVLGQGSAAGEAYTAFQRYALQLAQRGVILAVCSKNDEANALAAFERHPEMVLRRGDIACFVANWQDKATNLRQIAATLNIGLDALVFADDNPAERGLIRRELPMVAVPELPEDPAGYVGCLASAGYFEALEVTAEDKERTRLYRANAQRMADQTTGTDIGSFLRGLQMQLLWDRFDADGAKRIVQLINKTNQFNLTTKRYTDLDVAGMMQDPDALTLQMRLTDVYGDNGVIGLVVGYRGGDGVLAIDTWLMSCRVLGRGVEEATLNIVAQLAREMGCTALMGEYRPTAKNGMVREHYSNLGFRPVETRADGSTRWSMSVADYLPRPSTIRVLGGAYAER